MEIFHFVSREPNVYLSWPTNTCPKTPSVNPSPGIPLVAVIGESEVEDGVITVKNMSSRDEVKPKREDFIQTVKDLLQL